MNDFKIQSLAYIIDVSNGVHPEDITAKGSELDVAEMIQQAITVVDVASTEFETIATALNIEKYCSLKTIELIKSLQNGLREDHDSAIIKEILAQLTNQEIPGKIFKKSITYFCLNVILMLRLVKDYKTYIDSALKIIKDEEVKDIIIFNFNNN